MQGQHADGDAVAAAHANSSLVTPAITRTRARAASASIVTPRRAAARKRLQRFKKQTKATGASDGDGPCAASTSSTFLTRPILTPVRATRAEKELHGSDFILTPVRRSSRKTPSRYRDESQTQADLGSLLQHTEFAYKPNAMLLEESAAPRSAPRSARRRTPARQVPVYDDDGDGEGLAVAAGASGDEDMLSQFLFGGEVTPKAAGAAAASGCDMGMMAPIAEEEEEEEDAAADGSPRLSLMAPREATLVSFSPCPGAGVVPHSAGARAFQAASQLGSVNMMAPLTPARLEGWRGGGERMLSVGLIHVVFLFCSLIPPVIVWFWGRRERCWVPTRQCPRV